jgi:short-subunit dehydrogenase
MNSGLKKALVLTAAGVGAAVAARAFVRNRRRIELDGRVVLITGGSRGLGLVTAREFARLGARLALLARDADELERARVDLVGLGADVATFACDVREQDEVDATIAEVLGHFGRIDVLVNNAGVIQVGPFEETTLDDFDDAMRTHFWAPLYTTLAVLPAMRARGEGRIVNIASIGGKVSAPHLVPYSSSKFALIGLSEGLRAELIKDGVYVTTVAPGLMRTGSIHKATFKGQYQKEFAWFALGDSMPGLSMSAEAAASRIVDAARHGDAEAILSLPAKLMAKAHGVAPGLFAEMMGVMNRFVFPAPGGIGKAKIEGKHSRSALTPSWATYLSDQAALRNNEL